MSRFPAYACALAIGLLLASLPLSGAFAHCFVGPRFFPATLVIDDPCVADELSLPTVSWSKTGDVPPASEWDISGELSKRITEDFGISIGETGPKSASRAVRRWPALPTWRPRSSINSSKIPSHETAMLLGLIVDWGNTGATNAGIGTPYSFLTPTYYFGQGFGQLPDDVELGAALRHHRADRLSNSDHLLRGVAKSQHPSGPRLRRVAAIQHAVSEIRGERLSAA